MQTSEVQTRVSLTRQQLERYKELFVGRRDDFALQQDNGRYQRVGRPLTDKEIVSHLIGTQTIGTYVINEQGRCNFAVFDADMPDGLSILREVQRSLAHDGYCSYLEMSRRPGHLWLFFHAPVPASQVRSWFLPYCPAGVEFYPKQDESRGYGSLVRLPFGVHRRTGKRYPFVQYQPWKAARFVPVASTLLSLLNWLEHVECLPVPAHRLEPLKPRRVTRNLHTHQSLASTSLRLMPQSATNIHAWCAMQDPFQIIGRVVQLNSQGLGCCPFHEHHAHGRDRHPSFKVYEPRRVGGSCWYCYTWNQGGNVFDFLCRWHNVDARTMWQRIQQGAISL